MPLRMLRVQAERDMSPGFSFGPDTHWQHEFEDAFPFEETADQLRAIAETKRDMESERPMDRLICGDVGFGKTEVAIRAVIQSGHGRKAGGPAGADDRARAAALSDASRSA